MKKIGIINAGGDTQAINSCIASIVEYASTKGIRCFGFIKGFEGILDLHFEELYPSQVKKISSLGGTILHSVNKGRFAGKVGSNGELNQIPKDILEKTKSNLELLGLEAVVVIGGDGTLSAAMQLSEIGVKIVGIPKTIDNDLNLVDQTFGFSTAVEIAVEAIDRIHTTAYSHERIMFVETMGRNVGWIALFSGLASNADVILIPEIKFDYNKLISHFRNKLQKGSEYLIVVVSEGASAIDEEVSVKENNDNKPEVRLGGISESIMNEIYKRTKEFEMRNIVLGHVQRGGTPDSDDRVYAKTYGVSSIDALLNEGFGKVLCLRSNKIYLEDIANVVRNLKKVTTEDLTFQTAKKLGIYFGE